MISNSYLKIFLPPPPVILGTAIRVSATARAPSLRQGEEGEAGCGVGGARNQGGAVPITLGVRQSGG